VKANPLGRWYARFICPHCRGALRFDAATNAIGLGGSLFFFLMVFLAVTGEGDLARIGAAASAAAWLASLGLSYSIRRVVKG
jgi:hypothetical protein